MRNTLIKVFGVVVLCFFISSATFFTTTKVYSEEHKNHEDSKKLSQNPEEELKNAEELANLMNADVVKDDDKDYFRVEAFGYPLDEKWMSRVTSHQGLRGPIEDNAGGAIAGASYHNAIDIGVPEFTPVRAAKSGTVVTVYPSFYNGGAKFKGHPIYGGLIEIAHNDGTKTLYAHLSMTEVREGDTVTKGQLIGRSGGVAGKRGSGNSTGPHLHYAIILDMESFIEKISN